MSDIRPYEGKRLLVLGGAVQCLKVVEAAKEMGVYTITTDISKTGPATLAADESLPYSVMDIDALMKWCKANPVDGVLNFCVDFAQMTHQKLCEEFGFPSYGTEEIYGCFADKMEFKKLCMQNDVDIIPFYDEEDIDSIEYPVMVKPTECSGSKGIRVCYNKDELAEALVEAKKKSADHNALIERYYHGYPEFSFAYIIVDGEPYLTRSLDRFVGSEADGLQHQCICARYPSAHTDLYLETADKKVKAMLKKIGMKNGTVFLQGFLDGEKFRFYDQAIRFSGAEYEFMLKKAVGLDVVKPFIAYALGGSLTPLADKLEGSYALNGKCGLQLLLDAYPGKIESFSGVEEVSRMPEVAKIVQKRNVGYVVPDSTDAFRRVLEIIVLTENNKESIKRVLDEIRKRISVRDPYGKELLTPMITIEDLFKEQ